MTVERITVPDFGGVQKITVVEVFIKPGEVVAVESSLVSLESDKAVMEIPSPLAGTITEVALKAGDAVASGDLIALIEVAGEAAQPTRAAEATQTEPTPPLPTATITKAHSPAPAQPAKPQPAPQPAATEPPAEASPAVLVHATPSVRALARELGVDLTQVKATGPKGRILKEDVAALVKQVMARNSETAPTGGLPTIPLEDFSIHGPVEDQPLNRIQKISGPHLHRSWVNIPHVTHFEEADITELDRFRQQLQEESKGALRFSPLVFAVRAAVAALQAHPLFNSSLVPGEKVVLKRYYHMGIAVDTPQGLTVPVIRDCDRLGLGAIAAELARLGAAAREGKLTIGEMQGASFTISSLGGIGGAGFTPIVNAPQAAILGLSTTAMRPVWNGETFTPRLVLPFSVSYDHRIIDGAEAARFCRTLRRNLEDLKRVLL